MRNLKSFYPFESTIPALFKGFLPPVRWDEPLEAAIRLDVIDGEKAFTVKADVPGVNKEDIFVDVDGDTVTIRAEIKREDKGTNALYTERFEGMMSRTFTLPMEVDMDATTARYENGVLWLTLPKKAGASAHRVTIN